MKLTLYHGGSDVINQPEIREPERTLDFGRGFYTTTSYEQAEKLVRNRLRNQRWDKGYVNTYLFDFEAAKAVLRIKQFDSAGAEWVEFVLQNRMVEGFSHDFDLVIGPVADDAVYTQLSLFEGGILSKETLIEELKAYKLVDQYLYHTPKSLQFLEFQNAKLIENESN